MRHPTILGICTLFAIGLAACTPSGNPAPGNAPQEKGLVITSLLPDKVYRASISIINPPKALRAGEQAAVNVKVKNIGDGTWAAHGQGSKYKFDLGNHWQDKTGAEVVGDDGRAGLPHDLKPGEEAELLLTVKAPKPSGDYILVLDMVHEDVTWFNLRGSQVVKTNVTVQ